MMKHTKIVTVVSSVMPLVVVSGSLVLASPQEEKKGLGMNPLEAIQVCNPEGQREYLEQIRCPGGEKPTFRRLGSVGSRNPAHTEEARAAVMDQSIHIRRLEPGETDYHVIDLYTIECSEKSSGIYMDMYHCAEPPTQKAPLGFTLEGQKKRKE